MEMHTPRQKQIPQSQMQRDRDLLTREQHVHNEQNRQRNYCKKATAFVSNQGQKWKYPHRII